MKIYHGTTLGSASSDAFKQAISPCWSKETSECLYETRDRSNPWCENIYQTSEAAFKENKEEYEKIIDNVQPCDNWPDLMQASLFGAGGLLVGVLLGKIIKTVVS